MEQIGPMLFLDSSLLFSRLLLQLRLNQTPLRPKPGCKSPVTEKSDALKRKQTGFIFRPCLPVPPQFKHLQHEKTSPKHALVLCGTVRQGAGGCQQPVPSCCYLRTPLPYPETSKASPPQVSPRGSEHVTVKSSRNRHSTDDGSPSPLA